MITLTIKQAELVVSCLARAIVENAFKDCVVPDIGEKTIGMIQRKIDEVKSK